MEEEEFSGSNMDLADAKSLLVNMEDQRKQLQLKRRWLMGLPISKSEKKSFSTPTCLPESFVREDDLFPGRLKKLMEQIRGKEASVSLCHNRPQVANIRRFLGCTPDALTNNERLNLVAGGGGDSRRESTGPRELVSTRKHMKMVIKEALPRNDHLKMAELSHILSDPDNVNLGKIYLAPPSPSSRIASAVEILDSLECLTTETLFAMHRALKEKPPTMPRLKQARHGWTRQKLIHSIREMSRRLLPSQSIGYYGFYVDEDEDEEELLALPPPLVKALAIAGLSFKYTVGMMSHSSLTDFVQFPQGTLAVQDEIAKAIAMIGSKKVRVPELRRLQLLLDPLAVDVPNGSLRTLLMKMLTEYLFDCGGEVGVPKSLSEALAIVNRSSRGAPHGFVSKEEIEEEVERVLDLSARMKQLAWDLLPEWDELDQDFYDAYMEELEESEEEEDDDSFEDCDIGSGYKDDQEEHVADNTVIDKPYTTSIVAFNPMMANTKFTTDCGGASSSTHSDYEGRENIAESSNAVAATDPVGAVVVLEPGSSCGAGNRNAYLGIQEASDEASMVAYHLIGRILEGLADKEGLELDPSDRAYLRGSNLPAQELETQDEKQESADDEKKKDAAAAADNSSTDVFLGAVRELLPSLPKSGMDKLKDLLL